MSPLIQKPDIALRLKKFLGLTELPDSVLAPEIVGTIQVGDLSEGTLVRPCMGGIFQAGVAAEFSIAVLRNTPAGGIPRDHQVVCQKVIVTVNTSMDVLIGNTGAALGALAAGEKSFADNDLVGAPSSEVGSITEAVLPAMNNLIRFRSLAGTPQQFLIMQGRGFRFGTVGAGLFQNSFIVVGLTVNIPIHVSYEWTEHSPDPS